MAITANTHAPLGAVSILRVVDQILAAKKAVVRWNEKRMTRDQLSRLTNEQLEDIGLTRYEVHNI
ncbi:DUF1127 domain-containing protein [Epibacterium sp. SM1979]|uniref:DUF1127 domain-containing protein n=1 Tax=Tritonibacter litoralis TaxID=2662264 RepID=A0A843YFE3_9RHOB|nr:DUF1127 domain-containing protein [Tritonibacter litoralis]MQQ08194.1 DUF1127 domain-containing protein [Tritonibacter litoralis]